MVLHSTASTRTNNFLIILLILALLAASAIPGLLNSPAIHLAQKEAAQGVMPVTFFASPYSAGQFQAQSQQVTIHFLPGVVHFPEIGVDVHYIDANPLSEISAVGKLPSLVNFYVGNDPNQWRTAQPTYGKLLYSGLYPGIDLTYENQDGKLKSTFQVGPGADPAQIGWHYEGAVNVSIAAATGDLLVEVGGNESGWLSELAPSAWQIIDDRQVIVPVVYTIGADGRAGFSLGAYDPSLPLVIDPVISFSSYLAGTLADTAAAVAVDGQGNSYIAGSTLSTNFLGQSGTSGTEDVWVMKVNATGSIAQYITYLVGNDTEQSNDISVDANGNVYVTGTTSSTNFPTASAAQANKGGGWDLFATKLNASGGIAYSTYLGMEFTDNPGGITVDSQGKAYVVGQVSGKGTLYKLAPDGSMLYGAQVTGTGFAESILTGVAVNGSGEVFIAGMSTYKDLISTPDAFQTECDGIVDEFRSCRGDVILLKLNNTDDINNLQVLFASYYGGISEDRAEDLALASDGSLVITGKTISTNFPVANAAISPCPSGTDPADANQCANYEAFVTRFSPDFAGVAYSTYYGGDYKDYSFSIDTDGSGAAYITGWTEGNDLPQVEQFQAFGGGTCYTYTNFPRFCIDSFVAKFNSNGSLSYSTFLGGNNDDFASDIAVEIDGDVYVAGSTLSTNYQTTAGSLQASAPSPGKQGFITKIGAGGGNQPPPLPPGDILLFLPLVIR